LDNDKAWIATSNKIIESINDLEVINKANIYHGFNDFNDFLMSK
jgi:hypothetical protein